MSISEASDDRMFGSSVSCFGCEEADDWLTYVKRGRTIAISGVSHFSVANAFSGSSLSGV